jgi:hypothetical protein
MDVTRFAMRYLRGLFALLVAPAFAALPAPAGAQGVGSEFQVNTYTTGAQWVSSVAADATGNSVVVWESIGQDGSGSGIFGQRYDSAGAALGGEFQVNSYTSSNQRGPSIASDGTGNFVVVWESSGQDGSRTGIFGQRYDSEGVARGDEFRVNSYTTSPQFGAAVASDSSGDFVVVWESYQDVGPYGLGIFGQRYNSDGVAQGGEFQVNSVTSLWLGLTSVASAANGDFVVAWTAASGLPPVRGIRARRFDSHGVPQGSEFGVSSGNPDYDWTLQVASDPSGNFVVVWGGQDIYGGGQPPGVFGRRYDSSGDPQGGEFQINSKTATWPPSPSVAADAHGNFLVAWRTLGDGSSNGVFGQRYDSEGTPQGEEFQINSFTTAAQAMPSVAATDVNEFVVAWQSNGQDGSSYGVFGQRLDFAGDSIVVVSPNTNVKWRIGSLHQIQWTHNLGPGATFRLELDRNNDGSYEELIASAAPVDSATRGSFGWTVTGPPSGTARVRVSWTDDRAVSDASDVTFQIRTPAFDGGR